MPRTRPADLDALRAEFAAAIAELRRETAEELAARDIRADKIEHKVNVTAAELAAVRQEGAEALAKQHEEHPLCFTVCKQKLLRG